MDKNIVIGADDFWYSSLQIGCHQYAKLFANNGFRVGFISPAISPFHFLLPGKKYLLKEKARMWSHGGEWVSPRKIWAYVPFTFLPVSNQPLLRSKYVIENGYKYTLPSVERLLNKNGFDKSDILWLNNSPLSYLINLVKYKFSILRITDNNAGFSKITKNAINKEKELIQKVDMVIVTARLLAEQFKAIRKEGIYYIPNGADFEHFYNGEDAMPEEYHKIPSPRVVYMGSIEEWLDIELLKSIANRLKKISFILIGRAGIDLSELKGISNIYILGGRNYNMLPGYLKNADVGIIPFKKSFLTETVNPIKLYEYMACGLPVVSVRWNELDHIKSPALLANNYNEFAEMLAGALQSKNKNQYIEYARNNSWQNRFEKIMGIVNSN